MACYPLLRAPRTASKVKDEKIISQEKEIFSLQGSLGVYEAIQAKQQAFNVELTDAQKTLCSLDGVLNAAADQLSLG